MHYMQLAAKLAPELRYLRVGPARVAITSANALSHEEAIAVLNEELARDPYSLDILTALLMQYGSHNEAREAGAIFLRMRQFAPNSLPVRSIEQALQQNSFQQPHGG